MITDHLAGASVGEITDAESVARNRELTRLCALALGRRCNEWAWPTDTCTGVAIETAPGRWTDYDPLYDDAQAMELVKRFSLQIHHHGCADAKASLVTVSGRWMPYDNPTRVAASDLNRAIVECVAKLQASRSPQTIGQTSEQTGGES